MDSALNDRRRHARFGPPLTAPIEATLRPGNSAVLVNLSVGGALVHSERPLRPGSRVHVQLRSARAVTGVPARILRCGVAAIGTAGVTYAGALKFDTPCVLPWDPQSRGG